MSYKQMKAPDLFPVSVAKEWVMKNAETGGAVCPCCEQVVRIYKRGITASSAQWLIWLCKTFDDLVMKFDDLPVSEVWIDVRDSPVRGGDYAKLRHWGLIQKKPRQVVSPYKEAGMWQPTGKGIRFAKGEESVPKFCHLYRGVPVKFSHATVTIQDVISKKFSFDDLSVEAEGRTELKDKK